MAFAGVAALLRPLMHRLDELPLYQRDSLRSALVLSEGSPVDRFAAYVAILGVIAAEAEHQPVIMLVDDLHWLDPSSAEALLFLARRFEAERVLLLLATRAENLQIIHGLPRLDLQGIETAEVDELLQRRGVSVSSPVAAVVHDRTAGNPLALIEAALALDDEQRNGLKPLPDPIPVGRQLSDAYRRRLRSLPEATQRAILIAAACHTGDVAVLPSALAFAGLQLTDLEPGENADLLVINGGRIRFTHPLIRSAAYHGDAAADRRAAHRVLAEASTDPQRQDARTWHLVAASSGPDADVADQIEQLARHARARRAPAVAARAFESAARLTPDPQRAAARLLEAAMDAQQSGLAAEALAFAVRAQSGTDDPMVLGQALQLEGRMRFWDGTPDAVATLVRAATVLGEVDQVLGGAALAEAAMMASFEDIATGRELADMPLFAQSPEPIRSIVRHVTGVAGQGWGEFRDVELAMLAGIQALDPLLHPWISQIYGRGLVTLECWPEARALYSSVIAAARKAGAMSALPIALTSLAEVDFHTDRWWRSYAQASEALRISDETGGARGFCLANLALIEAAQGRRADCESHGREAVALGTASGNRALRIWARWALGLLEVGFGRNREALSHFRARAEDIRGIGQTSMSPTFECELIEALIRWGEFDEGRALFDALDVVDLFTLPDNQIRLKRCAAMLASDEDATHHFEAALAIVGESTFERARTQLAYGERLRRTRRRALATSQLTAALATFSNLGASGWVAQAEREIQAAGGQVFPAPDEQAAMATLTARELQVATSVATGASNREVAVTLFLSEKTVEFHLRKSFQKLGIRSRVDLTRLLMLRGQSA